MEKIRVVMEQGRIANEQKCIAKEEQPSKAELWKLRLEKELNARLVSSKVLIDQCAHI